MQQMETGESSWCFRTKHILTCNGLDIPRLHCQMRNDASNLNLHLQQHHLSDRPSCPHCNDPCESPSHYFMHCPLYNIHRQQLVDSFNKLNIEFTIQTILYGSETSDYNQNVKLFRAVHSFIKRSKRFDNNIVI